jgi:hypothetical protein
MILVFSDKKLREKQVTARKRCAQIEVLITKAVEAKFIPQLMDFSKLHMNGTEA